MDITMIVLPGNKPSKVGKICVAVGDSVLVGQELVQVESSKGARTIKSSINGTVSSIAVAEGDSVMAKDLLLVMDEAKVCESLDVTMIVLPGNKPSKVGKICVAVGDNVSVGQELVQVESSKGTRTIKASRNGTITSIAVAEGDSVMAKDLLLVMDAELEQTETAKTNSDNLCIIGGGPGGYVAAIYAAKKGKKVTLIEKANLGGTCLNVGCIPTKSIIKSSEVYHNIVNSQMFGLELATTAKVDMGKVVDRKNGVVDTLVGGIEALMDKNNITVVRGEAKFASSNSVEVTSANGKQTIEFNDCIIATGTKIARPNIKGINKSFVLDSTEALSLRQLPNSLAIIGGGVIGMEFAFLMRGFGVDVTVIEYCDHLLGTTDSQLVGTILDIAKDRGIKVYLSSMVTECVETENGGQVKFMQNDSELVVSCDKALLAFGRIACTDLALDKAGVKLNERGNFIAVNNKMATNVDNIYAIGDVNGLIQLAHAASHQGIIAVNNILGHGELFDINTVPSVIFTSPEIATVGISEDMAKKTGIKHKVGTFNFASNGKAQAMGEPVGYVKLISDSQDTIIGGAVIGPDAGTLIATITLAVTNKLKASDITSTVFAHPTTAESIHEAAMALGIGCLHQ